MFSSNKGNHDVVGLVDVYLTKSIGSIGALIKYQSLNRPLLSLRIKNAPAPVVVIKLFRREYYLQVASNVDHRQGKCYYSQDKFHFVNFLFIC